MEGSLIQKKKGGTWYLKVSLGWNEKKKRYDQKWINLKTTNEKHAELKQIQLLAELNGKKYVPPTKKTLSQFLQEWLKEHVDKTCSKATKRWYRMVIKNHIDPIIGKVPLVDLTALDVQKAVYNDDSDTTRRAVYSTLRAALNKAVKPWKLIKINPADDIEKPDLDEVTYTILSYEQILQFLSVARNKCSQREYTIYLLALNTGARLDEILGLRWTDINFKDMEITIEQQVVGVGNQTEFDRTKSKKSRGIVMVEEVAEELKRVRSKQRFDKLRAGPNWEEHGLIFTTYRFRAGQPAGRPVDGSKLSKKWFKDILEKAKLPDMRFHDLRHSFATYLLGKGVPIKVVSEMLGHSSVKVTEKYLHMNVKIQQVAIPALKAIIPQK